MNRAALLGLVAFWAIPAFSCTCVYAAKTPSDYGAPVVFRGTVTEMKTLPVRNEMKLRGRYAIKFRVDEAWRGSPQRTRVIYGVDDGTDCMGGSSYIVGKSYLVFANEQLSDDVRLDGINLWIGWTDVLAKGTPMLADAPCTPGGETSEAPVRKALRRLGKGSRPPQNK